MTYQQALSEYRHLGSGKASDPARMAVYCRDTLPGLIKGISPLLVWVGAQRKRMTTADLTRMCVRNPGQVQELMWGWFQ